MPCHEVRTVSVEFKVGNIDLLKKVLEKIGFKRIEWTEENVRFENNKSIFNINFFDNKISSRYVDAKELANLSNQIKRAYSEQVIDEIAKRQKWMKKKMSENKFQLQRF